MKTKHLTIILSVFLSFFTISCLDRVLPGGKEQENDEDAVFPFDFSTGKVMTFQLNYDVPTGYRVYFEAYTELPVRLDAHKNYVRDSSITPFVSGYTDENGDVKISVELPAVVDEIYVYSKDVGAPHC